MALLPLVSPLLRNPRRNGPSRAQQAAALEEMIDTQASRPRRASLTAASGRAPHAISKDRLAPLMRGQPAHGIRAREAVQPPQVTAPPGPRATPAVGPAPPELPAPKHGERPSR